MPDMAFELRFQAGSTLSWVWRLVYGLDDLSLSGVGSGAKGGGYGRRRRGPVNSACRDSTTSR